MGILVWVLVDCWFVVLFFYCGDCCGFCVIGWKCVVSVFVNGVSNGVEGCVNFILFRDFGV